MCHRRSKRHPCPHWRLFLMSRRWPKRCPIPLLRRWRMCHRWLKCRPMPLPHRWPMCHRWPKRRPMPLPHQWPMCHRWPKRRSMPLPHQWPMCHRWPKRRSILNRLRFPRSRRCVAHLPGSRQPLWLAPRYCPTRPRSFLPSSARRHLPWLRRQGSRFRFRRLGTRPASERLARPSCSQTGPPTPARPSAFSGERARSSPSESCCHSHCCRGDREHQVASIAETAAVRSLAVLSFVPQHASE